VTQALYENWLKRHMGNNPVDERVSNLRAYKNSLSLVAHKANTENLSDHDVAILREGAQALDVAIDTIQELRTEVREAEMCNCEPYDATCWYAAFIAGFNAASMAECPQKLEEFRASMNRDPYMDVDETPWYMEENPWSKNPWSNPDPDIEVFQGTPSIGPRGETQFDSFTGIDLNDPDTDDILVADVSKVAFINTDCHGDLPQSHTEKFKDKNRIEQKEARIRKLEGGIQQLWEDTKR